MNPYNQHQGGGAYPPSQPGFMQPQSGGYPAPQMGGYQPPPQGGYQPPPQGGYQPQPQGGYNPQAPMGGYQPPAAGFSYPPAGGYYPPANAYGGPVISQQPGSGGAGAPAPSQDGWMSMPQRIPNCPPGLEYLTSIDQLLVKQKVELLEAFTGFETNNKFTIKNSLGQKVFWAAEENDCCTRNCCGPHRPFDMKIMDIHKNQVLHLYRPLRCDSCCFPCCLQAMEVSSPPGSVIGTVEQNWSILKPSFDLKDQTGTTVLKIEGPFCTFSMCGDVEFEVLTVDGRQVGRISKQWSGLAREIFTDADHFGISFPLDLDVRMKAVLIGACFLIDVMFFEKSGNQESDRPGMF